MKRITKKSVTEARNKFFRERERWGENNLATVRAECAYRDLEAAYEVQQQEWIKHPANTPLRDCT